MFRLMIIASGAAALLSGVPAQAQKAPPRAQEVSIPFVTRGGMRTFESDRDGRGIYIQNSRRDWFYASFGARCLELPHAVRIGFRTFGGGSTLERGDTIIAGRERCRITSITRSGPPPKKIKRKRR